MGYLDFAHGGNIYEVRRKYKKEIIDFSANINPLGLPERIKENIINNFNRILHYPDLQAEKLTEKLGSYWKIDKENILLGNGSIELIYLIFSAFKPKSTFIPVPTFSEYERAARSANSKVQFLRLKEKDNFNLPERIDAGGADIFFLCNPNNPTGNLILQKQRADNLAKLTVIDETFMDFLPDQAAHSLIGEAPKNKKIIVLRSFTKFFALPGLRIGYLIAHKDTVMRLRKYQLPWSVNTFAQMAAELALDNEAYAQKTNCLIKRERSFLFREIAKINRLSPYPSRANFILIKINDKEINSSLLKERLIEKGILVRDCANFRGLSGKFIRIAVRARGENQRLIQALGRVI
ncbi:MAG: threonine-phosphate decarboxylase [Candidatus Omnitrophota bacterium]|nr:MAG: threonine-phosphate decarboxylase [Candidatus Omnitrophota bacterium]